MNEAAAGPGTEAASPWSFARVATIVGASVPLWLAGTAAVRWLGARALLGGQWTPLTYAGVLVAAIALLLAAPKLVRLAKSETLVCASLIVATTAVLNAIALRWQPWIFGGDSDRLVAAAALLQWQAGIVCAVGLALSVDGARR